jgi:hypothetical protein
MSFDAYTIAVKLSLVNGLSGGLASISKQFLGLHGQAGKTNAELSVMEGRLKSIGKLTLIGGALAGVGGGMLHMLKGPYEEAKKLAQAQADFQTLNLSATENAEAYGQAAALSHKVLGTTITQNIKNIHDLHTAFGDLHHAIDTSELFTKMSLVAKVANGGQDVDGLIMSAAKALEHRGGKVVNNPAAFAAEANMMTQVMLGTKMRVSPKDYLTASGTGKMAYQMFDPEYLYGNFAGLMSINGGNRSGTAAMTAFSSLVGGHMDNKGKGFLAELGLWNEGVSPKRLKMMQEATAGMSKEELKSMGYLIPSTGGLSDQNAELFSHRPDLFISNVLVPAIKKRFGMDLTDEQIALKVAAAFNRNTGDFLGTQITMAQKLGKDTGIIGKSMDIGQGLANYMKSPEGAEEAAEGAWKNFLAMFGSVYLPAITQGLLKLARGLDSLSQWMTAHPTLVKVLIDGFIALAAAMAFSGTVMLLKGGFEALGLVLGAGGGAAGLLGVLGKAGLAGAAAFAVTEVGRLGIALADLFNIRTRDGVKLSGDAAARLKDPAVQAQLAALDGVRPPSSVGGSQAPVSLVLTNGGRPLAQTIAGIHSKAMANNLGSGSYDLGVSQPPVNLRAN